MRGNREGERAGDAGAFGSLRKHTRNSMLLPVAIVGIMLSVFVVQTPVGTTVKVLLLLGVAGVIALHGWRMLGVLRAPTTIVPLRRAVPEALLPAVLTCLAVAATPRLAFLAMLVGMGATILLIGRPARLGWSLVIGLGLGSGVAISTVLLFSGPVVTERVVGAGVVSVVLIVFFAWSEYMCVRQWGLGIEVENARRAADELASTRERLRVAEDLHDVLGHALEVVAFKSELAARLSEHDVDRSRAEMVEVQRLARGALHDVRELVQGERSTNLASEFASVRDLLSSAGIECECVGEPDSLPESDSALFGRVLREAATNVLRHANPQHCTVTLHVDSGTATLSVRNDGSEPAHQPFDGSGSGLVALARRIEAVGGTFRAGPTAEPDSFEVLASVPVAPVR